MRKKQVDRLEFEKEYLMDITNKNIDGGKPFDWGRTSLDYARYRDIYPQSFYDKIINRKLCLQDRMCLIWELGLEYCHGNYIGMVQSGQQQIFQKIRLSKLNSFQKEWILIIIL